MRRQVQCAAAVLAVAMIAAGCAGGGEPDDAPPTGPRPERARFKNLELDGRDVREVDLNGDSEADQWYVQQGSTIVRVERDLNFDGRPDAYVYPDASGQPVEEEMDLDVDGVIDVVNYYSDGRLTRKEMSTDFTGAIAVVKFYDAEGELSRIERDTDSDGKVDVWEYYQSRHKVRTGRDVDGDGSPDTFDDVGS